MAVDRRASASKTLAARKKKEEQEKARKAVLTAAKRDVENAKSQVGAKERPAYRTGMKNANAGKAPDKTVKSPVKESTKKFSYRTGMKNANAGKTSDRTVKSPVNLPTSYRQSFLTPVALPTQQNNGTQSIKKTMQGRSEDYARLENRKAGADEATRKKIEAAQKKLHEQNVQDARKIGAAFHASGAWMQKGKPLYQANVLPGQSKAEQIEGTKKSLAAQILSPSQQETIAEYEKRNRQPDALERVKYGAESIGKSFAGFIPAIGETAAQDVRNAKTDWNNAELEALVQEAETLRKQLTTRGMPMGGETRKEKAQRLNALMKQIDALRDKTPVDQSKTGQTWMRESREAAARATEGMTGAAGFAARGALGIAQNAPSIAAGFIPAVGPALSLGTMGGQAAAGKMTELNERGVSPGEAFARGTASGLIEIATEKIPLENLVSAVRTGGKGAVRNLLKQAGIEATEEGVSYVANYAADAAAKDPEAQFSARELAESMGQGALSGLVFGGAGEAVNRARGVRAESGSKPVPLPVQAAQEMRNPQTFGQGMEDVPAVPLPIQTTQGTEAVQPVPLPVQTAAQVDVQNAPYKATNAEIRAILNNPQKIAELNAEGANIRGTNAEKRAAIRAWLERGNAQMEEAADVLREVPDPGILKQGTWKEGEVKPRLKAEEEVRPDSAYRSAEEEELLQAQLDDYLEREAGHAREAASREEIRAETREASDNLQEIIEKCKAIQAQLERGNVQPEETAQQAGLQMRKNASYEVMNERRRRDAQYLREMEVKREAIREWMNNEADWEMEATDEGKHEKRDSLQAILEKRMATQAWLDRKAERERMRLTPPPARPDRQVGLQTRQDVPREAINAEIREASDSLQEIIEKCEAIQAQLERENTQIEETSQIPQAETQEMKLAEPVPSSVNSEEQGNSRMPRRETEAVQPVPLPVEDAQKTESVQPVPLPEQAAQETESVQPVPLPVEDAQETEAVQPKILPVPGKDDKIRSTARMLHRNIVSGQAEIERLAKAQKTVNPNAADANDWAQVNRTVNSTVDTIAEKALVDRAGNRIDQGWREIIEPLTDMQRETLNLYRWHRHNIDRMSLEQRSAQMIEQARADLRAFVNEHPEFADANKRTLSRFMQAGGETAEKLVTQYEALQNKLGRLSSMENKPVLGYETEKGKKPYSAEQSAKLVEQMEQENPELRVWADRIEEFHDRFMREWVVGSGLLSEELYEEFKVLYPHYVQTYRQKYFSPMEQDEVTRQRNVNTKRPTKNAEGDMDELIHFEDAEMMQISSLVKNARRNEMFRNIYDFAAAHPDKASRYVKIVQKGGWDTDFAADTREPQSFDDLTGAMADEAMIEQGGVCILRLRVDGEVKKMAVSPDFYAGMQNLFGQDQGASDNFMKKTFGTLTNAFKQLTTGRNPLFFLTNLAKDFQTAYINTTSERKILLGYLADVGGTIQSMWKNSEDWQTFQALGGKDSGFYHNEKGFTRSLADAQKGKITDKIWAPVDMISENAEAIWRFNEYRTAIRRYGDTREGRVKAMQAAADITTNFSRSAPATKAAENYCAYLNASVQGLDKMARQIKEHPFLTTRRAAEIISLTTLLLYLVNRDNDDYRDLDNRTKDNYYCVPIWGGRFLKIPKSREYGVVMGALLERFFRLAEGEEAKKAFAGIGSQFFTNIAPSNPVTDNILKSVFIDLPTNRDFAGRSIVPERLQGLSPENQYDYSTSGAGRALAAGWNATAGRAVGKLSPIQMDYLLDTNLGFVGDAIVGMTQQTKGGEQLQKDWTEHPVRSMLLPVGNALKQKFVADPLYQSGVTDSFYDAMDTAEKEMNDRNLLEGLDSGVMTPEKKYYSELNKASLEISELRKQERAIMEDKSLSDAERDSAVRKLRREIVNLARAAQENAQKAREEYEKDMDFGVDEKTLYQAMNTVVTTQAPEDGSKSRKQAQREALMSLDLTAEQKTELASRMFGGNDMVSWQDMDSFKITNEMKAGDQKLAFALKRAGLDTERAMKYAAIVGETGATYTKGEDGHYTKDVKSIRLKKLNNMVQGDETLTDEQKNSVMRTVVLPELGKKYTGKYAAQFIGDIDAVQLIDAQAAYDEISETVKKDLTINEKNRSEFVRLRFSDYLESTGMSRSQQDRLWYFQSRSESDFKEPWSEIIRLGGEDVKKACPKLRDSGMDEATYKAIKAGMDRIYADKDANGETIKDSKKRKLIAFLNEYDDLTTEQKNLLMQADGYKYGMGEKPKSGSSKKKNPFVLPTPTKMPSLKSLIPF